MSDVSLTSLDQFPAFLHRLPPGLDLESLARETRALQRRRGVRSGADLLRLALAWGCSRESLRFVAAWAGERGIATLSDEALVQRLHGAGPFLQAVANHLLTKVGERACWLGRVLRIADSSSLSQPGSQGTDWRIHGVYDLGLGRFAHLEITDKHGGEGLDRGGAIAGEIRIGDRGYANAQAWQRFLADQAGGADFIVRMRWKGIHLIKPDGDPFDIIEWLRMLPAEDGTHTTKVCASSGKRQPLIPIRLIARRKSPQAIAEAHKVLRRRASRKQTKSDPRSYVAAEFLILATSLPDDFPAQEILAAYRLRWQIELAFKRLKSLIGIDEIPTKTEAGTRCWLYAHLIVALLAEDLTQDILDSFPSGSD